LGVERPLAFVHEADLLLALLTRVRDTPGLVVPNRARLTAGLGSRALPGGHLFANVVERVVAITVGTAATDGEEGHGGRRKQRAENRVRNRSCLHGWSPSRR